MKFSWWEDICNAVVSIIEAMKILIVTHINRKYGAIHEQDP